MQAGTPDVDPGSLLSGELGRVSSGRPETRAAPAKAGLRLTPSEVELAEGGDPAAYRVVLRRKPSAPVFVSISPDEQTAVSPAVLFFDVGDWSEPQQISVWAEDDVVAEGQHSSTIRHFMASNDPAYTGLDAEELTASIEDNDAVGIRADPTSLIVSEPDGTALLTVTLTSPPDTSVSIPLAASNDECTVTPPSVTLDHENFDSGAEATVSASDDAVEDGDQICLIQIGPSISNDPAFDGLAPQDVTVTVLDDDARWRVFLPQVIRQWPPLPEIPVLQTIDNADGDGTYSLRWVAAARAETYILEEDRNAAFSTARERYAGPATVFDVQRQGAARFYYRVKALNDWGESDWSIVQKVDVLWEAEPNDSSSDLANGPLNPGLVYHGTFPHGQDVNDYYFLDLHVQGTIQLWLQNIPAGHNYDLVLRDSALGTQPSWYSLGTSNQDEYVEATVPEGRYHIQIHNTSRLGSGQPYHLRVQY